ncbi:hypothetical protein TD95_003422 [Thielaviopsis punctulata]|uniref:Alpha-taxilin n=1 Tax=Thielaviopsis punctulata TaxID=72032 RepID=A0A0F4Z8E1_9PEZI|nr:hypothetical protein TD95_003422 [Thielaviopsis punctulata]
MSSSSHDSGLAARKGKKSKVHDASENTTRLLEAKISQLEREAASDKDQEAEIEREVKRANRDLAQQISKMDESQKVDHLLRKASELLADMRRMERENQKNKKRGDVLQKDKDAKITELGKTQQLKEKLEKLCRELQKDNNKLKSENKCLQDDLLRTKRFYDENLDSLLGKLEGYQREKDNPVTQVIDVSTEELFKHRFKTMIEQYELRDLHFQAQMRTKEMEVQMHLARLEQQRKMTEVEMIRTRSLQAQVNNLASNEAELVSQINLYAEKLKQAGDPLLNSELFTAFRKEISDISKRNRTLERENRDLKRRQRANVSMLQMAGDGEECRAQTVNSRTNSNHAPGSTPLSNGASQKDVEAGASGASTSTLNGHGHHDSNFEDHSDNSTVDDSDEAYHTSDAESELPEYHKAESNGHVIPRPSSQVSAVQPARPIYGPERPPAPSPVSHAAKSGSSK